MESLRERVEEFLFYEAKLIDEHLYERMAEIVDRERTVLGALQYGRCRPGAPGDDNL
jgi:hypothetical protein